jgi:hypothetical protein
MNERGNNVDQTQNKPVVFLLQLSALCTTTMPIRYNEPLIDAIVKLQDNHPDRQIDVVIVDNMKQLSALTFLRQKLQEEKVNNILSICPVYEQTGPALNTTSQSTPLNAVASNASNDNRSVSVSPILSAQHSATVQEYIDSKDCHVCYIDDDIAKMQGCIPENNRSLFLTEHLDADALTVPNSNIYDACNNFFINFNDSSNGFIASNFDHVITHPNSKQAKQHRTLNYDDLCESMLLTKDVANDYDKRKNVRLVVKHYDNLSPQVQAKISVLEISKLQEVDACLKVMAGLIASLEPQEKQEKLTTEDVERKQLMRVICDTLLANSTSQDNNVEESLRTLIPNNLQSFNYSRPWRYVALCFKNFFGCCSSSEEKELKLWQAQSQLNQSDNMLAHLTAIGLDRVILPQQKTV